jgi:hypothetical protein
MKLNKEVESIIAQCFNLYEFERKQIISILIMSTLTDKSNDESKEIYNSVIDKLNK